MWVRALCHTDSQFGPVISCDNDHSVHLETVQLCQYLFLSPKEDDRSYGDEKDGPERWSKRPM